jgi:hypothetical protein
MGWPKGVPRKPRVAQPIPETLTAPTVELTKAIPDEGAIVSEKNSVEEIAVSVYPVRLPSLASRETDPFTRFKTDEKRFAYKAINTRPNLKRQREAEGWETIPGSEYGDLVLAKIPKSISEARTKMKQEKTERQTKAIREGFREEAARSGFETFEDK